MRLRKIYSAAVLAGIVFVSSLAIAQQAVTVFVQPTGGTPVAAPVDSDNYLKINCMVGCGGGGSSSDVNITQVGGNTTAIGNGVTTTGTLRVTVASDSTGKLAATQSGTWNITDVSGTVSLPTGASTSALQTTGNNALASIDGKITAVNTGAVVISSGTLTTVGAVTGITNALPAGSNTIGGVNLVAATTGGCTPYHLAGGTAASTNSTAIKASAAGTLCHVTVINTTATLGYLKLYDSAAAPTCSSATGIKHVYPIPASTTGAGFSIPIGTFGEAYASGIGFCVTGGGGDTDNTSTVTGIYVEGSYK